MTRILVIDHGFANVASVTRMLHRVGVYAEISKEPSALNLADKIVLPGVGAYNSPLRAMRASGMFEAVQKFAITGRPILGICVGMQMMAEGSSEGTEKGFGFVKGRFESLRTVIDASAKVPHMGWNIVKPKKNSDLFAGFDELSKFYFLHSYAMLEGEDAAINHHCSYAGASFVAAFEKNNFFGVQFHPEKSHKFGMKLISNFVEL